jgi:hypothetical protein
VRSGVNGVAGEFGGGAGRTEGLCWSIGGAFSCTYAQLYR